MAQVRRSVTSSSGLLCPRCPIPFTTVGWLRSCRLGGVRDDGADLTHNAVHTYQLKVHANAQVLTFDPQGTLRADRNNKTVVLKPFAFATAITGTVRRRGRPHRRGVLQPKTPSASSATRPTATATLWGPGLIGGSVSYPGKPTQTNISILSPDLI